MKKLLLFVFILTISTTLPAQIFSGNQNLSVNNNMSLDIEINDNTGFTTITLTGPSNNWHAVGFGNSNMSGTYALIIDGNGNLQERSLGFHNSGSLLTSSTVSFVSNVNAGVRTSTIVRNNVGLNQNYFNFQAQAGSITYIWARGSGVSLANHGSQNRGSGIISINDDCNIPIASLTPLQICQGDSVKIFGEFQKNAGQYYDTLSTSVGCDSVIEQSLAVTSFDLSLSNINGISLMSNDTTSDSYQWINCTNDSLISGATTPTFSPQNNDQYAVILQKNGCVDTSICANTSLGISEAFENGINLFPNPARNFIIIQLPYQKEVYGIQLFNLNGTLIEYLDYAKSEENIKVEISHLPRGLYWVALNFQDKTVYKKFIIE